MAADPPAPAAGAAPRRPRHPAAPGELGVDRLEERLQKQLLLNTNTPSSILPTIALIDSSDTARLPSASLRLAHDDGPWARRK